MEVSVQKCESSDIPKKSRSVDLKSVYAEKPWGLDRKPSVQKTSKGLKRENSSPFESRRSLTGGPRRKRSRKEASLSSFGPVIVKKQRNGVNPLRRNPNGFSSGVGKPEKLSRNSSFDDELRRFGRDNAADNSKKNDHGTLSLGSPGSSSGLVDGVIIPKKPRGISRHRKLVNTDDTKAGKDDCGGNVENSVEPLVNGLPSEVLDSQRKTKSTEFKDELSSGVASPSLVSDGQRNKISSDSKDELSTDVAFPSKVSDGQRNKRSVEVWDDLSTDVASTSLLSDVQRKKKSPGARDDSSTDIALSCRVSHGQRKKKSSEAKDDLSNDAAAPSLLSDGQRKKKSIEVKFELSTAVASPPLASDSHRKKSTYAKFESATDVETPSQGSDGRVKKKSTDHNNELSADIATTSQLSDAKGKKKSADVTNEYSLDVGCPFQFSDGKGKKKSSTVKNEQSNCLASPSQASNRKRKKKAIDGKNQLSAEVASSSQVSHVKRKRKPPNLKENGSARNISVGCIEGEKQVRRRKKNSTILVRGDNLEKGTSLAYDGKEFYGDFLEEDLEQNAARMLSSRFDPSCTGFSGSRESSSSKSENGFCGNSEALHPESSSVDAAGRMLRPRKRNGKSLVRKRRHFYEVSYRDMDPYCMIKQRIRVFWPLDKSWYFGLVKDYDPVTRLHHVKYDDRDEEWINLRNERFKLLLFPSEISGKVNSGKSQVELKRDKENNKKVADDSFSNCTESEPIIAWLTRSKQRRKLSAPHMIKRRTHVVKDFESSLSLELQGHCGVNRSHLFNKLEEISQEGPRSRSTGAFTDREVSFVYFRKKFHKRREELDKTLEHDCGHVSSASSINILASVADSAAVLEELDLCGSSMEQKQVMLILDFQQLYIHDLASRMECSLWHALFLLQFGTLTSVWPMVHMEIVLVDNVLGIRLLLFEGSLGCAAGLLCLITRSFCQPSKGSKFEETQMPSTSIGINLSGLFNQGEKLLFLLYRFFGMEGSKWRYMEDKLKRQCVTIREVPLHECMSSTFKNLQHESNQMLDTSIYKTAISLENSLKRSYSDILHQSIPEKKACSIMNPTICYIDEIRRRHHPYTKPSFVLSLHISLLIEKNESSVSFQKRISSSSQEASDSHEKLVVNGCCPSDRSDQVSDITIENIGTSLAQIVAGSGNLSASHLKAETDAFSMSNDGDWMRSSRNSLRNEGVDIIGNSVGHQRMELNGSDETVVQIERLPSCSGSWQDAEKSSSSFPEGCSSPEKSEGGYDSYRNNVNGPAGQIEQPTDKGTVPSESLLDLSWEMNGYSSHHLNPTAPRSVRHCNGHSLVSPKYGQYSKLWQEDFMRNGFFSGSKKPRTHVSYSLPFGGFDLGSKRRSHHRRPRSYKKIRTDDAKRLLGVSANSQSCREQLACNANVLVSSGDKGWRECGAQVVLGSDDQKDWRICVKVSGATKYAYKAQHVVQPGITNRYTHAMMWKGGKDWTLEFTDRSQWSLFKEIHEECYNRNMRAAYVKNIPIPGVRLIADDDYDVEGVHFLRSSSKYLRQIGAEVDMALDPAHVLYDMDSDDERWVSEMKNSVDTESGGISEATDEMFERVMDIFEKFAYAQQCDEFSNDEIEEFMADVGPLDIVKTIYEYWRQKRLKKGMALIRQFQPACWVRYQQQLKEWESATSKMRYLPDGSREKACPIKKPPMFAFCLRPRGLEVPNKLLKQRSHKKFVSTGSHSTFAREQDGFHPFGRRTNGLGDERTLLTIPCYESSDSYHSNDGAERFQYPELCRSNSKKRGAFLSPRDLQIMPFSHNKKLKGGTDPWGTGAYESASMSQIQRDGLRRHRADIDEFKLRDASNAAQHASNMARLKREKAQWLIHKADLAIHKATVALMIAEAMKESKGELTDDDDI